MGSIHVGDSCLSGTEVSPLVMSRQARRHLETVAFDTIVGTGMSGALVVPILARELDVNWVVLRKPGDHHHHPGSVFGYSPGQGQLGHRWLFVDDGIKTGSTVRRVRQQVREIATRAGHQTSFAGAYVFADHDERGPYGAAVGYYSPRQVDELMQELGRYAA